MMGVFAEFERAMIRDRIHAGLSRARSQGKRLGRPRVPYTTERAIRAARAEGKGILKIAREVGVGTGTVQRVISSQSITQGGGPPSINFKDLDAIIPQLKFQDFGQ